MNLSLPQDLTLLLVVAAGTGVVLTRNVAAQTVALSFFGLILAVMFALFQAPDVALSQLVIGAVALPLTILLTRRKIRRGLM